MDILTVPPINVLRKGEFLHLLRQHIDICHQFELASPIAEALGNLETGIQPLMGRLSRWRRESLTEELESLDKQRGRTLGGLHLLASCLPLRHCHCRSGGNHPAWHAPVWQKTHPAQLHGQNQRYRGIGQFDERRRPMADAANKLPLAKGGHRSCSGQM